MRDLWAEIASTDAFWYCILILMSDPEKMIKLPSWDVGLRLDEWLIRAGHVTDSDTATRDHWTLYEFVEMERQQECPENYSNSPKGAFTFTASRCPPSLDFTWSE